MTDKERNERAWNYAIGIVQVEGIKPSKEFLELVEKEKRGEMTGDDIRRVLCSKYKVKDEGNDKISNSTENIDIYHLVSITPAGKILELANEAKSDEEALFYMGLFNLKAEMKWDEIINE